MKTMIAIKRIKYIYPSMTSIMIKVQTIKLPLSPKSEVLPIQYAKLDYYHFLGKCQGPGGKYGVMRRAKHAIRGSLE